MNGRLAGKRRLWGSALALLAMLLVVLTGCQPVGNVDLNRVLLNQLDLKATEGSGYLELTFDIDETTVSDPAFLEKNGFPPGFDLTRFSSLKLGFDRMKVDEEGDMWLEGALEWGDGSVPFSIHTDEQTMLVRLDDVSRPIAISLADETVPVPAEDRQQLVESFRGVTKRVGAYLINNLPNPSSIRVTRTSEPINGVTESLVNVQAEWNGEELAKLIPAYLDALVQDEQGLNDAVRAVLEWTVEMESMLQGVILEQTESDPASGDLPASEPSREETAESLSDEARQQIVEEQLPQAVEGVKFILQMIRNELASLQKDDPAAWAAVFHKGHGFRFNLYVDSSLTVRKLEQEFRVDLAAIAGQNGEPLPVRGVTLRVAEERWNVNGDVDVPDVTVPRSALTEEELDGMKAYRFLRLVNPDSALYRLLKHDLAIDDQQAELYDSWDGPFVERNGVLYVPLRKTLDDFDIQVWYDKPSGTIRFYDGPTGREFALRPGSAEVQVNGETVRWAHPALTMKGSLYVPADEFFKLFGATYERQTSEGRKTVLTVKRDL